MAGIREKISINGLEYPLNPLPFIIRTVTTNISLAFVLYTIKIQAA
jgi:hypothetical protein